MELSDYIAAAALLISLLGFGVSLYGTVLDRSKIKVKTAFYGAEPTHGHPHIVVKVTNHGRRAAILSRFGGNVEAGGWESEQLEGKSGGVRLDEGEFIEKTILHDDVYVQFPEGDVSSYFNFWFEDSVGRRYVAPQSERHIAKLKTAYGDLVE